MKPEEALIKIAGLFAFAGFMLAMKLWVLPFLDKLF
jgi:hypothetical protein